MLLVEASETVFPAIFSLRRSRLERHAVPISVYCACAEEEFLRSQDRVKDLVESGYGLLTVDSNGNVLLRNACVPIQQIIHREIFEEELRGLPMSMKRRMGESFRKYSANPPSGVTDVTEVFEGVVLKAAAAARKANWLTANEARGPVAGVLQNMHGKNQFQNARAAIGSAQGYISQWRNLSHHFPKNQKAAGKKYRDCRHAFLEGLKQIANFKESMSNIGLNYRL